jgi:aquaporin Z
MRRALSHHWPEYLIEAWGLGTFMVSACLVTALLEHPASSVHPAIGDPTLRRALIGVAMGLTAVGIVYSPWGKQSGAHLNPAMTLTFWRLGKVASWDAAFYVVAQAVGAVMGVGLSAAVLGAAIAHPSVGYAVTVPGASGSAGAFAAEVAISFGLMTLVLTSTNSAWASWTGVFCGLTIATYITIEAPVSGMSMNPARTLGSALPSGVWTAFWVYLAAPPLGMLAAAEVFTRRRGAHAVDCAKLHHQNDRRCIHCNPST